MALRLGMPVGLMLREMSSPELTEWMAFFELRANPSRFAEPPSVESTRVVLDAMIKATAGRQRPPTPYRRRKG